MTESFTWLDGERTICFAVGAAEEAAALLAERGGFHGFTLLTTERTQDAALGVVDAAASVVHVPPGKVDELSAALLDSAGGAPLVALGGGRVVDTAKAIGGATGQPVATLATTLSGAELTRSHRRPAGHDDAQVIRPVLVIADPALMTGQPEGMLAASAMNALAHAMEALYTPFRSPVTDLAALRAATLLSDGVYGLDTSSPDGGDSPSPARCGLALGAVLAGYACDAAKIALHHAVCQTIVRTAGAPHAETNAVMLPHSARLMVSRAPDALGALAGALGDPEGDADAAPVLLSRLAAHSGHTRLRTLGVEEADVEPVVAAVLRHPLLALTPDPPDAAELRQLVAEAL